MPRLQGGGGFQSPWELWPSGIGQEGPVGVTLFKNDLAFFEYAADAFAAPATAAATTNDTSPGPFWYCSKPLSTELALKTPELSCFNF